MATITLSLIFGKYSCPPEFKLIGTRNHQKNTGGKIEKKDGKNRARAWRMFKGHGTENKDDENVDAEEDDLKRKIDKNLKNYRLTAAMYNKQKTVTRQQIQVCY